MENNNIFAQWDNAIGDIESLQKDIQSAAENSGDYKEVPTGKYDVAIEKIELKASKTSKKPMVSVQMKILKGEYEGSFLFMNQTIDMNSDWRGLQIHTINEFLRSLIQECTNAPEVEFKTFVQYADLLLDIHEMIADDFEYEVTYSKSKKDYNVYKITAVYALEYDDIPF